MPRPRAYPSVLLLAGAGLTAAIAERLADELSAHFEVRGPWNSDFTIHSADDALALLDAADVDQAHVVGLSFGGVVAQETAIRQPERVRSLVLGATTAGGPLYVPPEPRVRHFVRRLGELPPEEGLWASVPYLYAAETRRERAPLIGEDIARRLTKPVHARAYRRQHTYARAHDASRRLERITMPTLVVHGEQDRVVPFENARLLASAVAGAQLVTLPGGAHAFLTDAPSARRELVSFLLAHSPRRAKSAPARSGRPTDPGRPADPGRPPDPGRPTDPGRPADVVRTARADRA